MEAGPNVSPVTRKSLAHATIDFLDTTKKRLDQLALNTNRINLLRDAKRQLDAGALTQGIQEQAIQTANDMLTALGGIAIRLQPGEGGSQQQIVRLTAIKDFVSPEGPPSWLVAASPTQLGILAIDFLDAKERLHEY